MATPHVVGNVTVTVVVFDYNAVASLYDRTRAVLVERKTTSKERTIDVAAQPVLFTLKLGLHHLHEHITCQQKTEKCTRIEKLARLIEQYW
jgi:hypothetical protein